MRYYSLFLLVLIAMIVLGFSQLRVRNDIQVFLPDHVLEGIPATRLLAQTPQSSIIMLGIEGAEEAALIRMSDALVPQLQAIEGIEQVSNGAPMISDAFIEQLFSRRYHMVEHPEHTLTTEAIAAYLQNITPRLASSEGMLLMHLLPRDPSGVFEQLIASWKPPINPLLVEGVWFSDDHHRALLIAYQQDTPFDADKQTVLRQAILDAFEHVKEGDAVLRIFSPYMVALTTHEAISAEAVRLGIVAMVGILFILWFKFRKLVSVITIILPLAFGALCAVAAVQLVFGYVHGLALAFGTTLMGLCVDYPIHMMLHKDKWHSWKMVLLGGLTTATGFLAMCFSHLPGLQQLGMFVVVGLMGALVVVFGGCLQGGRAMYPTLVSQSSRAISPLARIPQFPLRYVALFILALTLGLIAWASTHSLWNEDTTALTPVPQHLLKEEFAMRQTVHAPDARYLLLIEGKDTQAVLEQSEALIPTFNRWQAEGLFGHYELAARYVPSHELQAERQEAIRALPLQESITKAVKQVGGFAPEAFAKSGEKIIEDARLPSVEPSFFAGTPLAQHIAQLLKTDAQGAYGVVLLSDIGEVEKLREAVEHLSPLPRGEGTISFVDMRQTFASVLNSYREQAVLLALAGFSVVTLLLIVSVRALTFQVLLPVVGAVVVTIIALLCIGETLSLFHITALLLVVGIGIDYGLFFATSTQNSQGETLTALMLCSLTTVLGFGALTFSWVPVLHAMGITVSIGVVSVLVLGRLISQKTDKEDHPQQHV